MKLSFFRCTRSAAALAAAVLVWSGAQAVAAPTFSATGVVNAPVGVLFSVSVEDKFDNAGTNPRFTDAAFSTLEYYNSTSISDAYSGRRLFVQVKTAAQLNAMSPPPPSPFTVTVEVTMTNDEGQTATGTITFETSYARAPTGWTTPEAPATPPTISPARVVTIPVGTLTSINADEVFDNAGSNPRFTGAVFSTREYIKVGRVLTSGGHAGRLFVEVKRAEELNAMSPPPPSPFTFTVEVTMTNDEGQTATGTVTYEMSYARAPAVAPTPEAQPTFSGTDAINLPPGALTYIRASDVFDNAGTNARFTGVKYSNTAFYYERTGMTSPDGRLLVQAKTDAELRAARPQPPNPVTLTVEVTMTNDEGQTATGTITFETSYARAPTAGTDDG